MWPAGSLRALDTPSAANVPGGRGAATSWIDNSGNFWLFGGYGFDAVEEGGELNDLWMFSPTTKVWTWMGGASTLPANCAFASAFPCGQPGVYGNIGIAAASNFPGGRFGAASWFDKSGHFWVYGGIGFDSQETYGPLDDLWEFDFTSKEWTWIGGDSTLSSACTSSSAIGTCGWPAVYGTLGVPASGIGPGSRREAASWTDNDGNLWLFGGLGIDYDQYDLWEFKISSQQWAWMGGDSTSIYSTSSGENWCAQNGIYGTEGTPAIANLPSGRAAATTWTDAKGTFWLFGGVQPSPTYSGGGALGDCNDVWVFEPTANEWAWMNGEAQYDTYSCTNTSGTNGVFGAPAAANSPIGRYGAASWTDAKGNQWVLGGLTPYEINLDFNDLWVYQPAAPAPVPSFELIASVNPTAIGAMGPGAPTISTGTATVNLLVADGFNSPVTLTAVPETCSGATCITGSFSPATITGAGSTTLTISVTGAQIPIAEIYPITVTGTSGAVSQSTLVFVNIGYFPAATPSFSPGGGTYTSVQSVTLADSTPGAVIYYTTDGSTPTINSTVYNGTITVSSNETLTAVAGAPYYGFSPVATAAYTINLPPPNFSISGTAISVAPGATTGNASTITLTPLGGFMGPISLSCEITPTAANDPATCSIPASVTINGFAAQTTTLTVSTTSSTSVLNRTKILIAPFAGGTALAFILLVGIPMRRRRLWSSFGMLILLLSIVGVALGCGSGGAGGGGGGGGGGNSGTTPGNYTITVTGTSGAITQTGTVSLNVQ
jgi:hypothetical protein